MISNRKSEVKLCPRCLGQGRIVRLWVADTARYCPRCHAFALVRGSAKGKEAVA
jgi:Zn-finger nucleic acid-binding protein